MTTHQQNAVSQFKRYMKQGLEGLYNAARVYAKYCEDPDVKAAMQRCYSERSDITPQTWTLLENVGKGVWHRSMLYGGAPHDRVTRYLPIDEQTAAIDAGKRYEVALDAKDKQMLTVAEMSYSQAQRVFHDGQVRNIVEQVALLLTPRPVHVEEHTRTKPGDSTKPKATSRTKHRYDGKPTYRVSKAGLAVLHPDFFKWEEIQSLAKSAGVGFEFLPYGEFITPSRP